MNIIFPYPASEGDVFLASNNVLYTYDGVKWTSDGSGVGPGIETGATISNTAPTLGAGGIWWNSVDGRSYVKYGNIFIDLSPSLVPDPTTYVGNVSFDDITVTNVGNVIPAGNNAYSLGSEAFQWKDLWVSNNTIYINSVPITLGADNVLTVDGNAVLQNDSNTSITTTGTVAAETLTSNTSVLIGTGAIGIAEDNFLVVETLVPGGLRPSNDDMYLLGNTIHRWSEVHANVYYGDGSQLTGISGGGGGVSLVPNMVIYGNGSLYGNSNPGFTVVDGLDDDDDSYSIPVDFPLEFLGNSYSSGNVRLVSNSYLTFGPDSYDDYHPVGPGIVPVPAIYMGALDNSLQKYYYGYADGTDIFVIGYEGSIDTSGEENYPAIQWELQVNSATPDQLLLVIDGPGNEGASLNFPGGVWGVSNGEKWVDQFQPLPWFSNYADTTYNAITVAPVTPVAANTIAFVGPGVTIGTDGGTTYVNIDPFDNAIDVGYDTDNSEAVISSTYYGLRLTTAQDDENIIIAPQGQVQIQGGDRSSNQPGSGYNVEIRGGNAHDNPNTPGSDYAGGDVDIRGGNKVGNGTPGDIRLYTNNNSNQWTFGATGNLTLPGNTFAVNYANGTAVSIDAGGGLPVANGTSNFDIATANGNVTITANASSTWTFDTIGSLTLPGGSRLRPLGANLDIFAGTGAYVNLITSDESTSVGVDGGGGYITTVGGTWDFDTTGNLTVPGNILGSGNILIAPDSASASSYLDIYLTGGPDIHIASNDNSIVIGRDTGANVFVGNDGEVSIRTDDGATPQVWNFDTTGNLTAPGNISAVGNITAGNLTVGSGTITGGNFNGANFNGNVAFGTGTVGGSGNIFGGNLITTGSGGDITMTGGNITGAGNISAGNLIATGNIVLTGSLVGSGASPAPSLSGFSSVSAVTLSASGNVTAGNVGATGNVTAANFFGNGATLSNVATQVTGSWTVPVGNSTQSFTVTPNETYYLWVDCNIPNGILAWNATATVTNTNVPVVGAQYAWVYSGGGTPIDFTSIPNQFVGTSNTIVRSSVAPSATTNRFDFGINNISGNSVVVNYGYTKIS
jgi:hypothetical protein